MFKRLKELEKTVKMILEGMDRQGFCEISKLNINGRINSLEIAGDSQSTYQNRHDIINLQSESRKIKKELDEAYDTILTMAEEINGLKKVVAEITNDYYERFPAEDELDVEQN